MIQKLRNLVPEEYDYMVFRAADDEPSLIITKNSAGDMGLNEGSRSSNIRKLAESVGIKPERIVMGRQTHSREVMTVSIPPADVPETDGIITGSEYVVPAVTAADCMPIVIYDKGSKVRAALHSGWKGTGIVRTAVKRIKDIYGICEKDLKVILGPHIQSCCYNVDQKRAEEYILEWGENTVTEINSTPFLDMRSANINILEELGIEDIYDASECTYCNNEYGSFRRQGPENFVRMLALICYFK